MRRILIRFDDICPTMDYIQWNRAMELCDQYGIKPLIGVIPYCQDPELMIEEEHADFWDYILELQKRGYMIAMHGYRHVYDSKMRGMVDLVNRSEFAGHQYEEQFRRIYEGKRILREKGIQTDIFFAPSHSYDKNTLKALKENGFNYISDGKSKKVIKREGILCVPCRSGGCPRMGRNGYYTAVFHTNSGKEKQYNQLVDLCENYKDDIVCFEDFCNQEVGNFFLQSISENYLSFLSIQLENGIGILSRY